MARRVQEGDRPAVGLHRVGADVLRDAAGLASDDVGLADVVQCLTPDDDGVSYNFV